MAVFRFVAACFLPLVLLSSPSRSADDGVALGEAIASRECAGCHGHGVATGVTIQGVYVPSFSEIAVRPYQSKERLQAFLAIPRHPMPGLPLTAADMRNLADYILSLKP